MQDNLTIECKDGLVLEVITVPFEPVDQYKLLAEIGRVLVPTILAAQGVGGKSSAGDLGPAVDALFRSLTPDMAVESLQHVLRCSSVIRRTGDAEPDKIDLLSIKALNRAFKGAGLKSMLLAAKHALEVNFGNFSDVAAQLKAGAGAATAPSA